MTDAQRFFDDADEELTATSDYFWMLRSGIVEEHTPGGWRSFRAGYAAIGQDLMTGNDDEPRPGQRAA